MPAYPTPHIHAAPSDFAPTVLMPGDPLRAAWIANEFLSDARLVNNVRGVQGYTGTYRGRPISVMASGMGMPSIGIYSHELYRVFGVQTILRVGSAGSLQPQVKLRDLVIGMGAATDSHYAHTFHLPGTPAPLADYTAVRLCADTAERLKMPCHVGALLSTDVFYADGESPNARWSQMGVLAVEMEAAALYLNAARAGRRALAVCTVSDRPFTGESLSADERQQSFADMITVALETAVALPE